MLYRLTRTNGSTETVEASRMEDGDRWLDFFNTQSKVVLRVRPGDYYRVEMVERGEDGKETSVAVQ